MVSRRSPWLRWAVVFGLVALAAQAGRADDDAAADGVGIERGITRLICAHETLGYRMRSRAFIVDVGSPWSDADLVVAPAHVLPNDARRIVEDCFIVGSGGIDVRIAHFVLPEARTDLYDDWIVLVTAGRFEGNVGRLRVAALAPDALERMIHERAPLRLMLYSASAEQDDCVFAPNYSTAKELEIGVFVHSCRTWEGTSGAPIVVDIDGAPVVIAMNIGRRLSLSSEASRHYVSLGLALSENLTAAIRGAVLP